MKSTSSIKLQEHILYGSSRLGTDKQNSLLYQKITSQSLDTSYLYPDSLSYLGSIRNYEMSNHLGNVLTTFSDDKLQVDIDSDGIIDEQLADVTTQSDYYPFGMLKPGRSLNPSDYKFGFNGMESDNEVKGTKNSYDFGARMYDPKLGRWFTTDPLPKAYESPYAGIGNNPIWFGDPDGRDTLRMHLVEVQTAIPHVVTFKVVFYLIRNGVEEEIHPNVNKSGSSDIYFGVMRDSYKNKNKLDDGVYNIRFQKMANVCPGCTDEWHANSIFLQDVGAGQFAHVGDVYEQSGGCLIAGACPSLEDFEEMLSRLNQEYTNTYTDNTSHGSDGVSKSMLSEIREMYNNCLANNSTPGNFGFQITRERPPVNIKPMEKKKLDLTPVFNDKLATRKSD